MFHELLNMPKDEFPPPPIWMFCWEHNIVKEFLTHLVGLAMVVIILINRNVLSSHSLVDQLDPPSSAETKFSLCIWCTYTQLTDIDGWSTMLIFSSCLLKRVDRVDQLVEIKKVRIFHPSYHMNDQFKLFSLFFNLHYCFK